MPKVLTPSEKINRNKKQFEKKEKKILNKINYYKDLYEKNLELYKIKKKYHHDQIELLNDVNSKITQLNK